MNPKINKVISEIEKTKVKIAEQQSRMRELERTKTELENADIVAMVRGIDILPAEFEAFAHAFIEQRKTAAVPDSFSPPICRRVKNRAEDADAVHSDKEDMVTVPSDKRNTDTVADTISTSIICDDKEDSESEE